VLEHFKWSNDHRSIQTIVWRFRSSAAPFWRGSRSGASNRVTRNTSVGFGTRIMSRPICSSLRLAPSPVQDYASRALWPGDADNFRVYHTPGFGWNWLRNIPTKKSDLKDMTIHIRLAGVDAPELAHFGNPAQPFSKEAFDYLTNLVNQKKVTVDLLSKDRYNRIGWLLFVDGSSSHLLKMSVCWWSSKA